jgi:hypothetical protein
VTQEKSAIARGLSGLGLVFVFFGWGANILWLLYMSWVLLSSNWWSLLNPLFDLEIMFRWLTSWPFWLFAAVAALGYGLGYLAQNRAASTDA